MSDTIAQPPTSNAATRETEPEVVAAISSAEGSPDLPTAFRIGTFELSWSGVAVVLAAAAMIGYGATRWWRRR